MAVISIFGIVKVPIAKNQQLCFIGGYLAVNLEKSRWIVWGVSYNEYTFVYRESNKVGVFSQKPIRNPVRATQLRRIALWYQQFPMVLSIKQVMLRCSPVKMFKTLRCKQSPVIHGSLDCWTCWLLFICFLSNKLRFLWLTNLFCYFFINTIGSSCRFAA